jgi:hypothetical protein
MAQFSRPFSSSRPGAVAGEADQPFKAGVGRFLDVIFVGRHQFVVVLDPVEGLVDAAQTVHVGLKTIEQTRPCFFTVSNSLGCEQINRDQAHFFAGFAQVIELNFAVTPAAGGVVDVAFEFGGGRFRACGQRGASLVATATAAAPAATFWMAERRDMLVDSWRLV